jgi:glucoamylase
LLTGERGHYELAAGRDVSTLIRAMEQFSNGTGLLPEQIWDREDLPEANMHFGGPTGSANPLLWAHSEYLRLLRSVHDGKVFDLIPEVVERYQGARLGTQFEFWQPKHPIRYARKGHALRVFAPAPFRLHWAHNGGPDWREGDSQPTGIGGEYLDLKAENFDPRVEFTFFWKDRNAWEGRNYQVEAY